MAALSLSIQQFVSESSWKPLKVARSGLGISHLFFEDDLLIFGEASVAQTWTMETLLSNFCQEFRVTWPSSDG